MVTGAGFVRGGFWGVVGPQPKGFIGGGFGGAFWLGPAWGFGGGFCGALFEGPPPALFLEEELLEEERRLAAPLLLRVFWMREVMMGIFVCWTSVAKRKRKRGESERVARWPAAASYQPWGGDFRNRRGGRVLGRVEWRDGILVLRNAAVLGRGGCFRV